MSKLRVATGVAIGVVSVAVVAPVVGRACSTATQLSLGTSAGGPDSTVKVTGVGFDPSSTIQVHWGSMTGPLLATQAATGGNLNVMVTVPANAVPGLDYIVATDNTGPVAYVSQPFRVPGAAATHTTPVPLPLVPAGTPAQPASVPNSAPAPATGSGSTAAAPAGHAASTAGAARVAQGAPAVAAAPAAAGAPVPVAAGAPAAAAAPTAIQVPHFLPFQGMGDPREGFQAGAATVPSAATSAATGGNSGPWVAIAAGLAALMGLAGMGAVTVGRRRAAAGGTRRNSAR